MLLAHISPIQELVKGPGKEMLSEGFSAEWTVQRVLKFKSRHYCGLNSGDFFYSLLRGSCVVT